MLKVEASLSKSEPWHAGPRTIPPPGFHSFIHSCIYSSIHERGGQVGMAASMLRCGGVVERQRGLVASGLEHGGASTATLLLLLLPVLSNVAEVVTHAREITWYILCQTPVVAGLAFVLFCFSFLFWFDLQRPHWFLCSRPANSCPFEVPASSTSVMPSHAESAVSLKCMVPSYTSSQTI